MTRSQTYRPLSSPSFIACTTHKNISIVIITTSILSVTGQVCVRLLTYADNVALPAFAAARRVTARAANPPHAAAAGE